MFNEDIQKLTFQNSFFRQVVHTGVYSQVVVMSLLPNEDIGLETHPDVDQILFILEGSGIALVGGETKNFLAKSVIFVPAGSEHNFTNTGTSRVKLFTVYSPPEHPDGTVHKTKSQALTAKD